MAEMQMPEKSNITPTKVEIEKHANEKIKPIIKQDAIVTTKKSLRQKFSDTFFETDFQSLKKDIMKDIIIPGLKIGALTILNMAFFNKPLDIGSWYRENSYGYGGNNGRTNYGSYYGGNRPGYGYGGNRDKNRYENQNDDIDYRNIILREREDAEKLVHDMCMLIRRNGCCSVANMYDMLDLVGSPQDNNWGWVSVNQIGYHSVRGGWLIDVDRPEYLD